MRELALGSGPNPSSPPPKKRQHRPTFVVKFGACITQAEISATQERLTNELRQSLRGRRRTEVLYREVPASQAMQVIAETALRGSFRPESMPGNEPALMEFLRENDGWLVMASAWAEV